MQNYELMSSLLFCNLNKYGLENVVARFMGLENSRSLYVHKSMRTKNTSMRGANESSTITPYIC
jgi:hypothetical protein